MLSTALRMPSHWRTCLSLTLLLLACPHCATAGDEPTIDREAVLKGIREARLRLTRGTYRAEGNLEKRDFIYRPTKGTISIFCAFDYGARKVRWDREEPQLFIFDSEPEVRQVGIKYVRTPEQTMVLDLEGGLGTSSILAIEPRDYSVSQFGTPFDVRTFGLMGWGSIEAGVGIESALQRFEKLPFVESSRTDKSELVITVQPRDDVREKYWINPSRGFTITKSEMDGFNRAENRWVRGVAQTEVSWIEQNGVWVPVSLKLERHFNGREQYNLRLNWIAVNEEPDPPLFEISGLGMHPDNMVILSRPGKKPIVMGKIRDFQDPPKDE